MLRTLQEYDAQSNMLFPWRTDFFLLQLAIIIFLPERHRNHLNISCACYLWGCHGLRESCKV